jgi:MoaA/NifB/PqqE/SkfB family radical SAM enzyme
VLLSAMLGRVKKIIKKVFNIEQPNPYTLGPNILLTNYCNEGCGFCFAKQLMKDGDKKEITLAEYSDLLDYFERNGSKAVYLLGGEPTLHSNFKKVVKMSYDRGFEIELFTNGIFSDDIRDFLIKNAKKIRVFHINIATPSYRLKETKDSVNKFIEKVCNKTKVVLVITIDSFTRDYLSDMICIGGRSINKCVARIGVAGIFVWGGGGFSLERSRKIGDLVFKLSKKLIDDYNIGGVFLTQIIPCMFDDKQLSYIVENDKINKKGYGCYGKSRMFELKTDFKAIRCFGLSALGEVSLLKKDGSFNTNKKSMLKVYKKLNQLMIAKSKKTLPDECKKCKDHGYKKNNCPGPCLIRPSK